MARRLARRKATLTCQRGRGDLAIGGLYSEGIYSRARGSAIQRSIGYRDGEGVVRECCEDHWTTCGARYGCKHEHGHVHVHVYVHDQVQVQVHVQCK